MRKEIPIKIDKKDRLIMQQLEGNSRQSFAEIGRKVGLGSDTVEYRVNKLLRKGVINRMFAEPDLNRLGLKTYRIYIKVENITKKEEERLVDYFMNHPRGQWFAEFEGEWDYTMRYTLEDEAGFKDEMEGLMNKFGRYIKSKSIVITTQQSYLPIEHFTGSKTRIRSISLERVKEKESLDDVDRMIMGNLFENSRMKSVEIANRVGISADGVQYRIRRLLEKKIIRFFGIYYNSQMLGYERYKVLLWLHHSSRENEKRLIRYCEEHPNSTYLNRVVADWDLEVDFDARDAQELHNIVKGLRNKFPDMIRDHSSLVILREHIPNPFRASL
jgi:DNA-binding Lrp family transcriptional regulator